MVAEIVTIWNKQRAVKYDGTNGDEVCDVFGLEPDFDDGDVLKFTPTWGEMSQMTVLKDRYVQWTDSTGGGGNLDFAGTSLTDALLATAWQQLPEPTVQAATVIAVGSAVLTGSLLGETDREIDVTVSPTLSGTGYTPRAWLSGADGILGGHTITGVAVLSASQVRVTVDSGAASPAGQVHVLAYEAV